MFTLSKNELLKEFELLVSKQILTVDRTNMTISSWKMKPTNEDFDLIKKVLFDCIAVVRRHINLIESNLKFPWILDFGNKKLLKELNAEINFFESVMLEFLKIVSNFMTPQRVIQMQALELGHRLLIENLSSLNRRINENHTVTILYVAIITMVVSAFSLLLGALSIFHISVMSLSELQVNLAKFFKQFFS